MVKKIEQHYIPRVYLKNFQIDSGVNKSFVYCIDFFNEFNYKPQKKGINDKVFKERKFYTDERLVEPLAIENAFAHTFEPKYEEIIRQIEKEIPFSGQQVEDLMTWLFISKYRSPYMRAVIENFQTNYFKITNGYKGHHPDEKEKAEMEKYIVKSSKFMHLSPFSDTTHLQNLLKPHFEYLNAKSWRILKSTPGLPFWTNDNPGFSPNLNPMFSKDTPFHHIMELNLNSIIYYVLSPKYCLEIAPFEECSSLDLCALNMEVNFVQATTNDIEYVNMGVFYSRYKLLISNSKKLLDDYVKVTKNNNIKEQQL